MATSSTPSMCCEVQIWSDENKCSAGWRNSTTVRDTFVPKVGQERQSSWHPISPQDWWIIQRVWSLEVVFVNWLFQTLVAVEQRGGCRGNGQPGAEDDFSTETSPKIGPNRCTRYLVQGIWSVTTYLETYVRNQQYLDCWQHLHTRVKDIKNGFELARNKYVGKDVYWQEFYMGVLNRAVESESLTVRKSLKIG